MKTMQDRPRVASISIPALGSSIICPLAALTCMIHAQALSDDPLFQITTRRGRTPLTDSVARKRLKQVSIMLNTPKILTFHDFRRAGATWAFRRGVPVQDIQAQGTWSSACVWRYIQVPPHCLLQSLLHSRGTCLHDASYPYPYLALGAVLVPLLHYFTVLSL